MLVKDIDEKEYRCQAKHFTLSFRKRKATLIFFLLQFCFWVVNKPRCATWWRMGYWGYATFAIQSYTQELHYCFSRKDPDRWNQ